MLTESNRRPVAARLLMGLAAMCLLTAAGCGGLKMPRVHKVTVQQGNVVTQEMIDQLKPGMTRSQVAFIMGEPILRNTFNADRWDYLYWIEVPGYYQNQITMSLYFEEDLLAYFTGDLAPSDTAEEAEDVELEVEENNAEEAAEMGEAAAAG